MESITIYPKNEKQKSLIENLLKEMKVHFETGKRKEETLLAEKDYFEKIDKSIAQAEHGKAIKLSELEQKKLLGL